MTIKTLPAITEHGAETVYKAACAALEGDYSKLQSLGLDAKSLGDAFAIQSSAYRSMGDGARAREQMAVNGDLKRLVGKPRVLSGGQRKQVYLDAASLAAAEKLGNGNVSEGIRIALAQAKSE